jgi:hypothetical protein
MHLNGDIIAERRQGGFETGQLAGSARVDQARRLAVVDVEAAGKIGDGRLAGAQCAVERCFSAIVASGATRYCPWRS